MSKIKYHSYAQLKSTPSNSSTKLFYDDPFLLTVEDTLEEDRKNKAYEELINGRGVPVPAVGDIVSGTIVYVNQDGMGIECGYKSTVEIPCRGKDASIVRSSSVSEVVDVSITDIVEAPYSIIGSVSTALSIARNEEMQDLIGKGIPVSGTVVEYINHGLYLVAELDINGVSDEINIFVPAALIGNGMQQDQDIVGEDITVLLQSYNPITGNFVGSRKHYMEALSIEAIKELQKYPTVYTGTVTGIGKSASGQYFGVFVQFNECLTGMIHKANINPDWADRLGEIEKGQEIDFYVKDVVDNRIILTQQIKKSMWDTLKEGDRVTGKIKRVMSNGLFVSLDDDTFGIIPISQVSPDTNTNFNAKIRVVVSKVDRLKRNIILDLA